MKIALCGLPKDDNLGDPLILISVKTLLRNSLANKNVTPDFCKVNLRQPLDILPIGGGVLIMF